MQNELSPSKTLLLARLSHLIPQNPNSKTNYKYNPDPSVPLSEVLDRYIDNLPVPDNNMLGLMQRTCSMQEQKIHQKILSYRKLDLFEEMNKVSSELYELKYMDQEELAQVFSETMDRIIRQDSSLEETPQQQIPFEFPNIGCLSHSIDSIEKDENEDPLDNNREEKREFFVKMEEFGGGYSGLGIRKGKKFPLDFNNIHNFLEENENCGGDSPRHQNEMGILKEIDLNEGIQGLNSRLYE